VSDAAALARIRRGLGAVFALAGLLDGAETLLAVLYTRGKVPFVITAALWSRLHFAQFLFLVVGAMLYLTVSFGAAGVFYHEALADFLIGFLIFMFLWSGRVVLLVRGLVPVWTAFGPGLFLAGYGVSLRAGRTLVRKRADASANP